MWAFFISCVLFHEYCLFAFTGVDAMAAPNNFGFSTRNKFFKVIITTSLLFAGGILTIGMLNVRRVVGHFLRTFA